MLSWGTALQLTLSWRRSLSYRSQYIDLACKSMDRFLNDRNFRNERVDNRRFNSMKVTLKWNKIVYVFSITLILELFLVPFSVLRLNTEIYRVMARIHSNYGKIRAKTKSKSKQFSRNELSRIFYSQKFTITAQKLKFSITDFFSKCDQIHRKLRIWSHLLNKSLMENFICCGVYIDYKHSRIHLVVLISTSHAISIKDNRKETLTVVLKFLESFVKKMYISRISEHFTDSI